MHPHPLAKSGQRYPHHWQVKQALGLPAKLPIRIRDGRMHYIGQINGVGIFDYGSVPGKRAAHRLYALIGDRYIPCGRLHQAKL